MPPLLLHRRPRVQYRRERWDTRDGDFIDVDFASPEPLKSTAPVLVLFHGLEGSSRGPYARTTMRWFADRGWRALVAHFRGCSGEDNRLPRAYHSGDFEEGDWILHTLHGRWPAAPLYAAGVSLGGNMLAKWAGERGQGASFVTAAASISAPLDLAAGARVLRSGINLLYTWMFLRTLKKKALDKLRRFPEIVSNREHERRLRASCDLVEFDNEYTAPVHGFRDADHYYSEASAKPTLRAIRIPYLLLNARNDPFVPEASLPVPGDVSATVELEQPTDGGHVGFMRGPWPGRGDFIAERIGRFFAAHAARTS